LAIVNALHRGFGDTLKIRRLADPVPVTLDLFNPKSTGFDTVSRDTIVPYFLSHSDQVYLFYLANIHTHTHTYTLYRPTS